MGLLNYIISLVYQVIQFFVSKFFSPTPPAPRRRISNARRVAVIGAGITGVSSAAHCVGHGFEVTIFEAKGRDHLGGIWSQVNPTSSLQIHSLMYRFHPSVRFQNDYPHRDAITREVTDLWKRYRLDERTEFEVPVQSVWKDEKTGRWIVQDPSYGYFDGVIAAVGTCGDPKAPHIPGQENFSGQIYHSSQLAGKDVRGKNVIVVGGGSSAVEAVEFAVQNGAAQTTILARSNKWVIPRNPLIDALLSLNIFGEETEFAWVPEILLKQFFYRDLEDLIPTGRGLYTDTPMVNNDILEEVRKGKVKWLRGDIKEFAESGLVFNHRARGVPKGGPGEEITVKGDICIMATGFHRPSLGFLPGDAFKEPYKPPNWFLQTFPVGHTDICANNCTYINGIGTVGNIHIGLYTRLLLMFLVDPKTRPSTPWMRIWVDWTRMCKRAAPGGALEFFTYSELIWWIIFNIFSNPWRWRWVFFVLWGWGSIPANNAGRENLIINGSTKSGSNGQGSKPGSSDNEKHSETDNKPTYSAALASNMPKGQPRMKNLKEEPPFADTQSQEGREEKQEAAKKDA
ncbi:hypothetical protein DTO021C3_2993 [Paecilomyces variotii]|nr:hypothetical protein DTO195F2_3244 [Paecilomyces variotii]KAJ9289542.1 hypothetical protein DTO021C3_2993 [Paecilomyces variotii]KAJ9388900.1 hypothetical protein DTO063F5_2548 [Paecilomyces variotii]KAJ9406795.1 hypothetical protein DTO045G8_5461 [Paecilomyces variotii]